mmetsp:Transcript_27308/g.57845  ORF Transcript_27308/g.57845 Transcript_27308/m.57845 type:complete len:290 (+) Transcript_27308:226-1095(+)
MGKKRKNEKKDKEGIRGQGGKNASSGSGSGSSQSGPLLKVSRKKGLQATWHDAETRRLCCTISGVLSRDECDLLTAKLQGGWNGAAWDFATSRGPKHGEAERHHKRLRWHDCDVARALWEDSGLEDVCRKALPRLEIEEQQPRGPEALGRSPLCLSPDIRCYTYERGDVFGTHYDDSATVSYERALRSPAKSQSSYKEDNGRVGARYSTEYTLLLYLNGGGGGGDALVGGETNFYAEARHGGKLLYSIRPSAGMVLLHRHGHECLLHESAEVVKGKKVVLRTDVVFTQA